MSYLKQVLIEYTHVARDKGLLIDPVNIDKDLYGFVYAPGGTAVASIILSRTHPRTTGSL